MPRTVAITGARTFLGTELIRELTEEGDVERIVALDVAPPDLRSSRMEFVEFDLAGPSAGLELLDILAEHRPDTFVHGAFLSAPSYNSSWAHELEDVGTMHVLDACSVHKPERFVLLSTTLVYGASAKNPAYLNESSRLARHTESRFINDKVRADEQVVRFCRNQPDIDTAILRFAAILGPDVENFYTRFLSRPVAPSVLGYDPLIQVVHQYDAVRATLLALKSDARGPFNIVGEGVLPYSTVLALLGRVPVPMPKRVAELVGHAMWAARLSSVPGTLINLLQHVCVADGTRAAEELGFRPAYDIRQTLGDLLADRSGDAPAFLFT